MTERCKTFRDCRTSIHFFIISESFDSTYVSLWVFRSPNEKNRMCELQYHSVPNAVLEITVGHWPFPNNFSIWLIKIHFGWPKFLYIFNGIAINDL